MGVVMGNLRRGSTALLAVLIVAACESASGDNEPLAVETPPPATSADPLASVRDQALNAYRGLMRDFAKAAETADHGPSTLRRYADDQALAVLINALRLNDEQNAIAQGEPKLNPTIVSATPEKVVIEDCTDTSSVLLYNRKTGKPINDEPGGLRRIDATISRKEIGWKATKIRIWQVGSC